MNCGHTGCELHWFTYSYYVYFSKFSKSVQLNTQDVCENRFLLGTFYFYQ